MKQVPIDSLRLHPDAEKVPRPDASDLRVLRDSLQGAGQRDPVDITEDGVILDGRTRWELLRSLGATSVAARVVAVPDDQQVAYIVDRALARRHLTTEQKRALNALLRNVVVEVTAHPTTGEEMRIGKGATQRAAMLGVTRETVQQWDKSDPADRNLTAAPTHQIYGDGRVRPIHLPSREPRTAPPKDDRPAPLRKGRPIPAWSRHFSMWCRNQSRPEDRIFLRRLDREIHAALERNGLSCNEVDSDA